MPNLDDVPTPSFPSLAIATDVSAAQWLTGRLRPRDRSTQQRMRVGSLVPEGYQAYGRLLHPASTTEPGGPDRLRWSVIAAQKGIKIGADIRFNALIGWQGKGSPPPPYLLPERGTLDPVTCRILATNLSRFTRQPDSCWFCLWDGYGWLKLPPSAAGLPHVQLAPSLECLLFEGPVTSACNFRSEHWFQSPTMWWPNDRSWCVATDIDGFSTYIGGSRECMEALALDPGLEILPINADQEIDPSPYPLRY
jgi:hypothetical protein